MPKVKKSDMVLLHNILHGIVNSPEDRYFPLEANKHERGRTGEPENFICHYTDV